MFWIIEDRAGRAHDFASTSVRCLASAIRSVATSITAPPARIGCGVAVASTLAREAPPCRSIWGTATTDPAQRPHRATGEEARDGGGLSVRRRVAVHHSAACVSLSGSFSFARTSSTVRPKNAATSATDIPFAMASCRKNKSPNSQPSLAITPWALAQLPPIGDKRLCGIMVHIAYHYTFVQQKRCCIASNPQC